jgi:tetratricopeptide (TPR) repeat protein
MTREERLERYEARGEDADFRAAATLYAAALGEAADARVLTEYGRLLHAHGRNEVRRAVELYERAIALDPADDAPHFQLIAARAALLESEAPVAAYEQRLAAAPRGRREHRFLVAAYLHAHAFERALALAEAGLELVPDDAALVALRGEARAGLGDSAAALADWRRALELEPEDVGPLYASAFLLEREGRVTEALAAFAAIVEWHESRGSTLQAEWPRRQLERLRAGTRAG